jgi:hypothetical protein
VRGFSLDPKIRPDRFPPQGKRPGVSMKVTMRCGIEQTAELNRLFSHPAIQPHVHDDFLPIAARNHLGELLLRDPDIWVLQPASGVVLVAHPLLAPLVWDLHVAVRPECRGEYAFAYLREALFWLFQHTPAEVLVGLVPVGNFPARGMVRIMGFQRQGVLPRSHLKAGIYQDRAIYTLTRKDYYDREGDGSCR